MEMIQKNDEVWVNESKTNGEPLLHEWYGIVTEIDQDFYTIKDTNPESDYFGKTFIRNLNNLEKKE